MAVAEAMARGLTPVVHKSGGRGSTWWRLGGTAWVSYSHEALAALARLLLQRHDVEIHKKIKSLTLGESRRA
ncbi:hypothetical protein ODS41_07505 [Pyrobaculum sp. 3827-6]|nr:hypothetical protein [Pyrobaculum sp. 3827-6]MCU7787757.1 hypothetical protein [Pyrobaculum sp. 3827-6]